MHIVFLTNEYPKTNTAHGGIGTFVKFLANKLVVKGFTINVVGINSTFLDEFEEDNSIKIYRLKKSTWKFGKFIDQNKRVKKKINEINAIEKIDIVEGSELSFAFFLKKTSYKKVIRLHGGHHFFASEQGKKTSNWRSFQEKLSFKNADNFIAVTDYVGQKTKQLLKLNFNYQTIYNSIEINKFYKCDSRKEKKNKIIFVGTVCKKKGINELLLAFSLVKKNIPEATLEIIGRDWSSKKIPSYINFLKTKYPEIVKQDVYFTGSVNYSLIPKYIESAEVFISPSLSESFGLTLIEAMTMGKATVVSNITPYKEIVGNSNSVLFYDSKIPEQMSTAIIEVLKNKRLKEKLRLKSRKHIIHKFGVSQIIEKNIDFYNRII